MSTSGDNSMVEYARYLVSACPVVQKWRNPHVTYVVEPQETQVHINAPTGSRRVSLLRRKGDEATLVPATTKPLLTLPCRFSFILHDDSLKIRSCNPEVFATPQT